MEPLLPDSPVFVDIDEYPDTTQVAIEELAALGITSGVEPGRFDPGGAVTRWEMALFLDRTVTLLAVDVPESETTFEDVVDMPDDVIDAIDRIAALGITTGTTAETFEPEGLVTREQMAAFLSRTVATLTEESASS
jgi:hypothetical protein